MSYKPGDIILNKYRIEALIGRGAFAEVYRATHIDLNVSRALKILRRDSPGVGSSLFDDFEQRFRLEVQLGARISHPNAIHVYDVERDDEALILVMEYAAGGALSERIQQARDSGETFSIKYALKIAVEVAAGLGKLHNLDAVHRDLKPSNILFDNDGVVKIADLGLAQIPGGPSMRSQLSQSVRHPGTAGYMSPEQENTTNFLTPSSDVYALGVILFELLTGRNYHYIQPGTTTCDLREGIPGWLDDLLMQILAQEPEQRPWDGEQTAQLLQERYDGLVVERRISDRFEQERLEKEIAEEKKRQEEQARKQRQQEERARKSAERQQKQAERKTKRSENWTRFKKGISVFIEQWWKLISIIVLVAVIAIMLSKQYTSQEWPFLPTATPSQTLTLTSTTKPTNTYTSTVGISAPKTLEPTTTSLSSATYTPTRTAVLESTSTSTPTSTLKIEETLTPTVTPTGLVAVPDVVGLDFSAARLSLEKSGFQVVVESEYQPALDTNIVFKQQPEAGTNMRESETVTIYYALSDKLMGEWPFTITAQAGDSSQRIYEYIDDSTEKTIRQKRSELTLLKGRKFNIIGPTRLRKA